MLESGDFVLCVLIVIFLLGDSVCVMLVLLYFVSLYVHMSWVLQLLLVDA
jgi:hypothetical protein